MNFLQTFFGQIFRKSDVDFQNEGVRASIVQTHIDYTTSKGGIINGLKASTSIDGKSVLVEPGVFYSKGEFSSDNSRGGGERCQIFSTQFVTEFPETTPINGQPSYILIYAKTISENKDPDTTKSQNIATSKNIQTNENIPIRDYTGGLIVATNPILLAEAGDINGVPLALIQVNSDAVITLFDESVRLDYVIGGLINVPKQKLNAVAISDGFIQSRMIDDNQVIYSKIEDSVVTSAKLATWDGASSGTSSGSGVDTGHFKDFSIVASKFSDTNSLDGFSTTNHIFNGSFEINPNTTSEPDLVGWNVYNQAPGFAKIERTTSESSQGFYSVIINGANNNLFAGGVAQSLALYQDIPFSGIKLNNEPISSFFYMKTDADIPVNISGVSGITSSIQFMSAGSLVGEQYKIANYTGSAIDWTKFELTAPISYSGNAAVDGIRFLVSGITTNAVNIYLDNIFVGITSQTPAWNESPADDEYSDTLIKKKINTTNLNATNSVISFMTGTNVNSIVPTGSFLGNAPQPFDIIYTDKLSLGGQNVSSQDQRFIAFSGASTYPWIVPPSISRINIEAVGAGGGGAAGSDDSSTVFGAATISDVRLYAISNLNLSSLYRYSGVSLFPTSPAQIGIAVAGTPVIDADSFGNIFVITTNDIFYHYRTTGAITSLIYSSTIPGTLALNDVASDAYGNAFIATNAGVSKYTPTATIKFSTFVATVNVGLVACDNVGNVYVAGVQIAGGNNQVFKYNGLTKALISSATLAGGTISTIACDSAGNLLVNRINTSIVEKFNTTTWISAGTFTTAVVARHISCDVVGNVYVSDATSSTVYRYLSATGALNGTFNLSAFPGQIFRMAVGASISALGFGGGGGGGGAAGSYIKQSIAVNPGDFLTIQVGAGGDGGYPGSSGDAATVYYGAAGQNSSIFDPFGSPLATCPGGLGGGYGSPASVIPGGARLGVDSYLDNFISVIGNSGSAGNVSRYNASQASNAANGGGDGAPSPYESFPGGTGGVGWSVGGSHPVDPAMNGSNGFIGGGGGGGGGSMAPSVLIASGSVGGFGGKGGEGLIIIYY